VLDEQQYAWIRQQIDVSQWRRREISRLQPGEQEEPELLEVVFQQPEHSLWNDEKFKTLVTGLARELKGVPLTEVAVAAAAIILEPSPTQGASLTTIYSISRAVENLYTVASRGQDTILSNARDFVIAWAAGYCHPELTTASPHRERALLCIADCMAMRIREVDIWLQGRVNGWEPLSNNELWGYAGSIAFQFVSGQCEAGRSSHLKTCDQYHRLSSWKPTLCSLRTVIYMAVSGSSIREGGERVGLLPNAFAQSMLFYELQRDGEKRLRYGRAEVYDSENGTVSFRENWLVIEGIYVQVPRWHCPRPCNNYYKSRTFACDSRMVRYSYDYQTSIRRISD